VVRAELAGRARHGGVMGTRRAVAGSAGPR
jgi:hypothetical protein